MLHRTSSWTCWGICLSLVLGGGWLVMADDAPATDQEAAADQKAAGDEESAGDQQGTADDNPYVPRDDLSPMELYELIERMKDLPKSLQARPGFAEAIVICADRILHSARDEAMASYGSRARMDGLQRRAIWAPSESERQEAQQELVKSANFYLNSPYHKVSDWAKFYLLEDKVLSADKIEPNRLEPLLDEVRQFVKSERLDNRHVRLASATVRMINRLPDDEAADNAYKEFGGYFAASTDDELHRYGDRIAEGVPKRPVDMTGKQIDIVGPLYEGGQFDVANWKGKVVLIDFWATWCGPCRALLPELQATHEQYHDKGFEVLGISLDEDRDALKAFLEESPLPWPNIVDAENPADARLSKKYSIVGIPTTFLLDKEGKLVATSLHGKQLAEKIEELLSK